MRHDQRNLFTNTAISIFKIGLLFTMSPLAFASSTVSRCELALSGVPESLLDLYQEAKSSDQILSLTVQGQINHYNLNEFISVFQNNPSAYLKVNRYWSLSRRELILEQIEQKIEITSSNFGRKIDDLKRANLDDSKWLITDSDWTAMPKPTQQIVEAAKLYRDIINQAAYSKSLISYANQADPVLPKDLMNKISEGHALNSPETFKLIPINDQIYNLELARDSRLKLLNLEKDRFNFPQAGDPVTTQVNLNTTDSIKPSSKSFNWEPISDHEWLQFPRTSREIIQALQKYRNIVDQALAQHKFIRTKRLDPIDPRDLLTKISEGYINQGEIHELEMVSPE